MWFCSLTSPTYLLSHGSFCSRVGDESARYLFFFFFVVLVAVEDLF